MKVSLKGLVAEIKVELLNKVPDQMNMLIFDGGLKSFGHVPEHQVALIRFLYQPAQLYNVPSGSIIDDTLALAYKFVESFGYLLFQLLCSRPDLPYKHITNQ